MKIQRCRHISACLLLAVFLPAMVLASLHRHGEAEDYGCAECVKHQPHGDHIGQQTLHFSECLMCQFSAQSYLSGNLCSVALFPVCFSAQLFSLRPSFLSDAAGPATLRAPPFRTA